MKLIAAGVLCSSSVLLYIRAFPHRQWTHYPPIFLIGCVTCWVRIEGRLVNWCDVPHTNVSMSKAWHPLIPTQNLGPNLVNEVHAVHDLFTLNLLINPPMIKINFPTILQKTKFPTLLNSHEPLLFCIKTRICLVPHILTQ